MLIMLKLLQEYYRSVILSAILLILIVASIRRIRPLAEGLGLLRSELMRQNRKWQEQLETTSIANVNLLIKQRDEKIIADHAKIVELFSEVAVLKRLHTDTLVQKHLFETGKEAEKIVMMSRIEVLEIENNRLKDTIIILQERICRLEGVPHVS